MMRQNILLYITGIIQQSKVKYTSAVEFFSDVYLRGFIFYVKCLDIVSLYLYRTRTQSAVTSAAAGLVRIWVQTVQWMMIIIHICLGVSPNTFMANLADNAEANAADSYQ